MSEHNHECGCDCGHDHDDDSRIVLNLEDRDVECEIIAIFPVGESQYIAVTPIQEEEELYFFRLEPIDEDDDECELVDIEDEDEFDAVSDAFDELLDEAEWDDLAEDEE